MARHLTFVREPGKVPVVLSPEEVARLLEAAPGPKYKAALSAAYGAGLRVSEVVSLKVPDVDSKRMLLRIEQARAARIVMPCSPATARATARLVSHRAAADLALSGPQPGQPPDHAPVQPGRSRRCRHGGDQKAGVTAHAQTLCLLLDYVVYFLFRPSFLGRYLQSVAT
jgi:integrase